MSLRLFVDDIRRTPNGWTPARTVTEAIRILATQDVEEVSLDHDITCQPPNGGDFHSSRETFEAVARYIRVAYYNPVYNCYSVSIRIHTANVAAGKRMAEILGIPYSNEIFNEYDYK